MSAAEEQAWRALRRLRAEGVHVIRQHRVGRYIVDFAIRKMRIAIEIDGGVHDLPGRRNADAERQRYLERMGWRVIRFSAQEANNADHLLDAIRSILPTGGLVNPHIKRTERRTRSLRVHRSPSPGGEGVRGRGEPLSPPDLD